MKGISKVSYTLINILIFAALFSFLGCGESHKSTSGEGWFEQDEGAAYEENQPEETGVDTGVAGTNIIHMCGRSVLGGWFEYWGWDYDPANPVRFDGYTLVYHEMDSPPGIVDTAVQVAREVGEQGKGIMFFKLCFADFVGGDEYGARENLAANEDIISEVTKVAVDQEGLTLILGNALPMVREYTDSWLVWNHREYNRFLEDLAGRYGGRVLVLDLYGALATTDGWLRPEYASDPEDSHLNHRAYAALDNVLRDVLQQLP